MSKTIIHAMGMSSNKYGGLERYLELLIEGMAEYGYKTIIIYNQEPKSKEYIEKLQALDCEVRILNIKRPIHYVIGFLKTIIDTKPQIVLAHFDYYLPIILAALTFRKQRFIMLHSMLVGDDFKPVSKGNQLGFFTNKIRAISLKASHGIIAVSDAVRQQYVSLFNISQKIKTIYIGQYINYLSANNLSFNISFNPGKVKVYCIAFNSPIKGLDILINALALLKYNFKNNRFILYQIGVEIEKESSSDLLMLAKNQGVSDSIVWLGIRDDIPAITTGMDIYCQPSRSEGLPLSIVEASLNGIPTVATNVGGIPEAVIDGRTGLLFENENINDLAVKLNELILDEEKRKKMGTEAFKYASIKFDINKQSRQVVDFYVHNLRTRT